MHARLILASILVATALPSQSIIKNIETGFSNSGGNIGSDAFVVANNQAFFVAGGLHGVELWATNGTAGGTRLVLDLASGTASSNPDDLTVLGNDLYFTAVVEGLGRELWKTDGTPQGTRPIADVRPGNGFGVSDIVAFGSEIFFAGTDGVGGEQLWRTNGTSVGTVPVTNNPGINPLDLIVSGSLLFFTATTPANGRELWVSDGSLAGTSLVADLVPGAGSSTISGLAPFLGGVVFSADVGGGAEPYFSNGSAIVPLGDLNPGGGSNPRDFTAVGSTCYFSADDGTSGVELYSTDGASAGVVLDIRPGSGSSQPSELFAFGNTLLFSADDGTGIGRELWRSNGTGATTTLVVDLSGSAASAPEDLVMVGNEVWYSAFTNGTGREVHRTDGTAAGTSIVIDLFMGVGSSPRALTALNNGVVCTGVEFGAGREPFFISSNPLQSGLLLEVAPSTSDSDPDSWAVTPTGAACAARDSNIGREIRFTDGTQTGTFPVDLTAGASSTNPTLLKAAGSNLFFAAGNELWRTNGTVPGSIMLTSSNTRPSNFAPRGSRLVFEADSANGREPWVTDGTVGGTFELLDIRAGGNGSAIDEIVSINGGNLVAFAATDAATLGKELWITNGTTAGTFAIDLRPGSASSNPRALTVTTSGLFFHANDGVSGTELWFSNGSAAGTSVLDIGSSSSTPRDLTPSGNRVFFTASAGFGREIYVSDGTLAGTTLVADLTPGGSSDIESLTGAAGGAFFLFDDGSGSGEELWYTDGSPGGTNRLLDIGPGAIAGVVPGSLTSVLGGTMLAFAANDYLRGLQLWLSDGTAAGTVPLSSFGVGGAGAVDIGEILDATTKVYFTADDGIQGAEPWVYSPLSAGVAYTAEYGTGCAAPGRTVPDIGATGGQPTLGNTGFRVTVAGAQPSSFAFLVLASAPAGAPLSGGCRRWVQFPLDTFDIKLSDVLGNAVSAAPIPNDPNLLGYNAYFQWGILNNGGQFLGGFDLSNALQIQIGN